jgi:uncharacterized protein (TIGR02270 family)
MGAGSDNRIIEAVVEQHAEEAAFLWLIRDAGSRAPHYKLWELAKLDNRVEAHLDGLRIAGDPGWEICAKVLEEGAAGEVFAAAVLAFESGRDERIKAALKAGTASPEKARGLVSALGWLSYQQIADRIKQLGASEVPALRRVAMAAAAVHRRPLHQATADALFGSDLLLKARALRAVGECGLVDRQAGVRKNMTAEDRGCRFWAAWAAALLFDDKETPVLRAIAESNGPYREQAVQVAMRRMEAAAANYWRVKMAPQPGLARLAAIGAGVIGDPEAVPWLIEKMQVPLLARVAGEAFTMITGVDIAYQDLDMTKPEGFEAGPTENPEDSNVAMDPDDNLPWPNPEAIRKWWASHQGEFKAGTRYLLGKPITPEWLQQVLKDGRQRQRAAAALELTIRQKGRPLFEVRAPGFRQQQLLGKT